MEQENSYCLAMSVITTVMAVCSATRYSHLCGDASVNKPTVLTIVLDDNNDFVTGLLFTVVYFLSLF